MRHVACLDMGDDANPPPKKPYEIRERLFLFACDAVRVARKLQAGGRVSAALSRVRLRVFRATDVLGPSGDGLIEESNQLVRIISTIIRNAGG
jgi:hypothetical protein